jgi:hypothetical protein
MEQALPYGTDRETSIPKIILEVLSEEKKRRRESG